MNQLPQQELNTEESFNLIVNLARQSKLNYDEHALVDKAINKVLGQLNKLPVEKPAEKPAEKKEEKKG